MKRSHKETARWLKFLPAWLGACCLLSPSPAAAQSSSNAVSREVSLFNFAPLNPAPQAVSREVSVFEQPTPNANFQAVSRELSLFNLGPPALASQAVSREVSAFNFSQPAVAAGGAVSRECSAFNAGPSLGAFQAVSREVSADNIGPVNNQAVSRELSLFNFGSFPAGNTAISRELSVLVSTNPVIASLGGQMLRVGSGTNVPIYLVSVVGLTNVSLNWVTPPGLLTNFSLQVVSTQICSSALTSLTNGGVQIQFATCPGQWLTGSQLVAWLSFTLVTNQPSAFIYPAVAALEAAERNGHEVANFTPGAGRIVAVGEQPLLECVLTNNLQPWLVLYGKLGTNYNLLWQTNLTQLAWQAFVTNLTMTNLSLPIAPPATPSRQNVFRAFRIDPPGGQDGLGQRTRHSRRIVALAEPRPSSLHHTLRRAACHDRRLARP
jgi:hypothetical protein